MTAACCGPQGLKPFVNWTWLIAALKALRHPDDFFVTAFNK
jgi:hypothetical protein